MLESCEMKFTSKLNERLDEAKINFNHFRPCMNEIKIKVNTRFRLRIPVKTGNQMQI